MEFDTDMSVGRIVNTEEQQFWSGPSGQRWVDHERAQDRLLSEALAAVIDRAKPRPGQRVLDLGCGTGALSCAVAEAVGPEGRLIAVDISRPLLQRAAQRLVDYPQASTLLADVESTNWPESKFDLAVSRFGVMFFKDPPSAFRNAARAMKPHGRMVFATWAPAEKNCYWSGPSRIAAAHLGEPPKSEPNAPGPMGMADIAWSTEQLRRAGLLEVDCEEVEVDLIVDGTAEDAADLALVIGPASRIVRLFDASAEKQRAIREDIAGQLERYARGGTVRIPAIINLYSAVNA